MNWAMRHTTAVAAILIALGIACWIGVKVATVGNEAKTATQAKEASRWRVFNPADGVVCVIYKDWRNGDTPPSCFATGGNKAE